MVFAIANAMMLNTPEREIVFRQAPESGGLAHWLALPDRIVHDRPPLVAVHGIRRNARQQAELFAERAHALGRPVIAPLFDRQSWPSYQRVVRRGRADLALIALMNTLRAQGIWQCPQFELFGFSGGAQFAHRFAMMHPHLVSRLTAASAGWYTFPDARSFPYGLSARRDRHDPWSVVTEHRIRHFLSIPTQICVGADDHLRDTSVRSGERIDAQQGANRLIRGIRWTRALRRAAAERGLRQRASFVALSGCSHDFRQCVVRGGLHRIVVPDDVEDPSETNCHGQDCNNCRRSCRLPRPELEIVS